jgi:hypothetical protein
MRLLGYVWAGLHCISVFEQENPKLDGTEVEGYFDPDAHQIKIKAGMPLSRQREILMHELFHLAYYCIQHAASTRKLDEEEVCTRVAPMIAAIINKNMWISAFIEDRSK